jgi:hypothetical protein
METQYGWKCPQCSIMYAPWQGSCPACSCATPKPTISYAGTINYGTEVYNTGAYGTVTLTSGWSNPTHVSSGTIFWEPTPTPEAYDYKTARAREAVNDWKVKGGDIKTLIQCIVKAMDDVIDDEEDEDDDD